MNGNGENTASVTRGFGDLLRLSGVHKYYGTGVSCIHALNGIDLHLEPGEIVAVCGPSGSGKTSLLNLIGMLEPVTEGSIVIASFLTGKLTEQARADLRADLIGMVFQQFTLIPVLTVRENVLLPLLLRGGSDAAARQAAQARADELLGQLGLATHADQLPVQLDASHCQRATIARALIGAPRLVLADEPTSRLDSAAVHMVMELFARERSARGTAFLITTRDQRQLNRVTRTVQLNEGRLQQATGVNARQPIRTPA